MNDSGGAIHPPNAADTPDALRLLASNDLALAESLTPGSGGSRHEDTVGRDGRASVAAIRRRTVGSGLHKYLIGANGVDSATHATGPQREHYGHH